MQASPLISIGLPLSLFIIMIGIGMTLTPRDFRQVAVYPRGIIVGTIAQILVMPALAFLIIAIFNLSPMIAVGLVIIAACPGGTTSNLFALMARGNVALSIVLTVLANLITIVSLPLFTNLALDLYMGENEAIRLPVERTIMTLGLIVLLPIAIGMMLKSRFPEKAQKAESAVSVFGGVVLAMLVVALVYNVRDQLGELLSQAGPAAIALNLAGIGIALGLSRLTGLTQRESMAVAVELGIKNGTIGLLVTLNLLESEAMSVPSAVYGVLMFFFGFLLTLYGRKYIPQPS
ncbi:MULTISPECIES: bile acid:sodium symporter family protein [Gammaproteobacteria]|uniref:Bile acid:sodium symporter family protein n=2 Tax=Halomonadaceae TaxID=28256 RepID=A0A9X5B6X6_9GAMM|nr:MULTISPECIES: bile acid:sodium symporter family protein [Gammaproteobacteria]KAA8985493.1 bile acid:sodium symporter family protein [Halospina sp. K52047b]MYL27974.1 bile acid:sodium symporter family protein [Halomonas utahensis]MYL75609.1 bile acid:sodium symporter family protein [Halomonas sp. 22501_18_FS]